MACADFDAKREFLVAHIERVVYNRYKVAILGSVPVQSATGETKLEFRIEGEVDIVAVRSNSQRIGRQKQKLALSPLSDQVTFPVAAE
jgi:hypothetical protein